MRWVGSLKKAAREALDFKIPDLPFTPQIDGQVGFFSDIAYQGCRQMRVEIVTDKVPFPGQRVCIDAAFNMRHKILFVAGLAGGTRHQFSPSSLSERKES